MNAHDPAGQPLTLKDFFVRDAADILQRLPFRIWCQRLLAGNPFYVASAAMMLYGIYLVSVDPQLASLERSQLAFNFSSLQLYEMFLVLTAIVLARRAIWYDSVLLVGLENMFVFVPFILISQASFLNSRLTWMVCGSATALAVGKAAALKRHFRDFNFPPALLGAGALFLIANVTFPLTFRSFVEKDNETWTRLSVWGWTMLLPLCMAALNLLPRPRHWGGLLPRRSWLPVLIFLLWMTVTCAHFYSICYLDSQRLKVHYLAPTVWVLAWTLGHRITDFTPEPSRAWRNAFLLLPACATLLCLGEPTARCLFVLMGVNAVLYSLIAALDRSNRLARHLAILSLFGCAAAMPESWGRIAIPDFSRGRAALLSAAGWAFLCLGRSRNPWRAIGASIILALGTKYLFEKLDYVEQFALQNALLYLLLHSLVWLDERFAGSRAGRFGIGLAWLAHSIVWLQITDGAVGGTIFLAGLFVLGCYYLTRLFHGYWGPLIIPGAALLVLLAVPVNYLVQTLKIAPTGHLTVLGSFILFALGTALALTKHRWNKPAPAVPS
jgi:hypothetical protein